jgi:iron complex outermembrane receptor protein
VAAPALLFNTRKSVDQRQAGVVLDHAVTAASALRFALHGGSRGTQQFQAIPVSPQLSPLHPGGVIDLERGYAGVDARWSWSGQLVQSPFTIVAGASADRLDEDRRGYRNFVGDALGVQGDLRRDETNRVVESGVFAQAEWDPVGSLRLLAGVRASRVTFRSTDHFVVGANPDDSGSTAYRATTPVAGLVWRVLPTFNAYLSAGRGFETPTTNELAYRSDGASGLNLGLRPAKSDHLEGGVKWREAPGWRASAALFRVDTEDEIVVDTNVGGRSTFRNAGGTRREGAELQAAREWGPVGVTLSGSALKAAYEDPFAGKRIPGVPQRTAYLDVRWSPAAALDVGLEARHSAKLFVNDANSDAAPAYTVAGARVAYEYRTGSATIRAFLRIDNLFDRRYAGSVIVNEGNSRFFEPAPQRTWLAGVSLAYRH